MRLIRILFSLIVTLTNCSDFNSLPISDPEPHPVIDISGYSEVEYTYFDNYRDGWNQSLCFSSIRVEYLTDEGFNTRCCRSSLASYQKLVAFRIGSDGLLDSIVLKVTDSKLKNENTNQHLESFQYEYLDALYLEHADTLVATAYTVYGSNRLQFSDEDARIFKFTKIYEDHDEKMRWSSVRLIE